jgi:predicted transcriptional regulator
VQIARQKLKYPKKTYFNKTYHGASALENFSNEAYYLFFSALANRTRLAIIDALTEGPKTTADIADLLEQNENTITPNVELLDHCNLLRSEGSGKEKKYYLNLEIIAPLSELLAFHTSKYCPNLKSCIPQEKLKAYMKTEAAKETYIEHE